MLITASSPSTVSVATATCPDNITAEIEKHQNTTTVSWSVPPVELNVTMNLAVGEHAFTYMLKDGSDCQFTVIVKG